MAGETRRGGNIAAAQRGRGGNVPAAQRGRPINVLSGIPDNRLCEISVGRNGSRLVISLPGTADLIPFIPRQRFAMNVVNLGPRRPVALNELKPGPILNHIADADRCSKTLEKADEIVAKTGRACFNHPRSVLKTTRDGVARMLSGIEKLKVPRTFRLVFEGVESLKQAIAESKIPYPVLVRLAGDHGGVSTIKIDNDAGLGEVEKLNARERAIYVTEFVDFASPDGRYRKCRIAIVGDKIFLRHLIIGDQWLLHAERRGKNTVGEEAKLLASFDTDLGPKLRPMLLEIAKRLDLDCFGMDCNIAEDGTVTLFEANACMNILSNTQASPNMWDRPIANIKEAVLALLGTPRNWRHPPLQARRG